MRTLTALLILGALTATARAEPSDARAVVAGMKSVLEPTRPSIRKLTMRVSGGESGETSEVVLGQARTERRTLSVVLAPESLRGTAFLVQNDGAASDVQWLYIPAIGRVRRLVSPEAYSAFLNSDFTYADLGFVDTGARYRLLGTKTYDGTRALEIEGLPKQSWYYGRTVTSVASDSGRPLERKLYDPAKRLWKVERWGGTSAVDGVPTVLRVSMEDLQAKTRTDIDVSAVRYDVPVPGALLEPAQLSKAASSPLWKELGG